MANYNTYPSFGIDSKIKHIQDILSVHLGFNNVDFFGRVQKSLNKDLKTLVPEFFTEFPKKVEVYYNDKVAPGGNVFFIDGDEHTELKGGLFEAKVKIVFMLNLDKLYQGKQYRADSEVQEHCIKLVKKSRVLNGSLVLEKGLENVLKGFDTKNIKLNDMQPNHIFSINGTINYSFSCNQ